MEGLAAEDGSREQEEAGGTNFTQKYFGNVSSKTRLRKEKAIELVENIGSEIGGRQLTDFSLTP